MCRITRFCGISVMVFPEVSYKALWHSYEKANGSSGRAKDLNIGLGNGNVISTFY